MSPYSSFGLWRNPFGELTEVERAALAVWESEKFKSFLGEAHNPPGSRRAIQLLGPCGVGKSTHLWAIQSCFPNAVRVYFPETGPRPRIPQPRIPQQRIPQNRHLLLVDEAQRMGWRARGKMLRHPGPLVVATHEDMRSRLEMAGFEVMSVDLQQAVNATRLVEIVRRRVIASCLPGTLSIDSFQITEHQAAQLLLEFEANPRSIEAHLYEVLQQNIREGKPWLLAV